ncbi:hypothetical protein [Acetomicrobium sp.]|uniref:hypothetical protein n=1 Tax=Acetomicrobium sp. TaxID=1872099 RepID=UPI002FC588DD
MAKRFFIPGSSLKGVFRGFSEKVLRTISPGLACEPFPSSKDYCAKKDEIKDEKRHGQGLSEVMSCL